VQRISNRPASYVSGCEHRAASLSAIRTNPSLKANRLMIPVADTGRKYYSGNEGTVKWRASVMKPLFADT
jgi:hypothetical protein